MPYVPKGATGITKCTALINQLILIVVKVIHSRATYAQFNLTILRNLAM
jgi:hypothetical protein